MGLTLLPDALLTLKYWPHVFSIVAYLINCQPTPLLNNKSPFKALFKQIPNYLKLKRFNFLCFPIIRPYNTNKLQPNTISCLFVGYSSTQNTYKLIDPKTKRIYHFWHVLFDENQNGPHEKLESTSTSIAAPLVNVLSPLQPLPVTSTRFNTSASPPSNASISSFIIMKSRLCSFVL